MVFQHEANRDGRIVDTFTVILLDPFLPFHTSFLSLFKNNNKTKTRTYHLARMTYTIDNYPEEWEPQDDDIELKNVVQGSQEWKDIEDRVHATLPCQIISIQRVQNKLMWRDYVYNRDRLTVDDKNERMLFYGTRNIPPHMIYESDEGFDFRYSKQGMWGFASYFSEKARHCYAYSSRDSKGNRQFFLARVALGDCIALPVDSSLRMPPEKGRTTNGVPILYNSVQGHTGGSDLFMIYANSRAYPSYLISYSIQN